MSTPDRNRRLKATIGRVAEWSGLYPRVFRGKMVIIAFHRVNDELAADGLTCSTTKFEAFLHFFTRHFRVVPFSEQVNGRHAGRDMTGTLSITLDDGYEDNFQVAAPILRRLRLPATFFITTAFIGTRTVAPWDADLPRVPPWMNWDQVRELRAQGFEIGSHTHTHIDMGTATPESVRTDLQKSIDTMRVQLNMTPELLAYPFGGPEHICAASRMVARELGFTCCASCFGGHNGSQADPFQFNRIGIAEWFASPDQFGVELALRRA